jgi:hypothetical protein
VLVLLLFHLFLVLILHLLDLFFERLVFSLNPVEALLQRGHSTDQQVSRFLVDTLVLKDSLLDRVVLGFELGLDGHEENVGLVFLAERGNVR